MHHAADVWDRLGVEAVPVQELLERSDAVTLQMIHAPRFNGWINERLLNHCKPGQLWVGISRGSLFDAEALALALTDGRIDAMMLDGAGPQFAAPGSVLHGIAHLHLTPRLGSHTREAKMRASWYLVHRIHETLAPEAASREPTVSSELMLRTPTSSGSLTFSRSIALIGRPTIGRQMACCEGSRSSAPS